jgi:hypothetical protein
MGVMLSKKLVFKPRRSFGWVWLIALALAGLASLLVAALSTAQTPLPLLLLTVVSTGLVSVGGITLALWFPTMRYALDDQALELHYGPILNDRVPLDRIKGIRRRDLGMTIWSSVRLPGIALFTVPYADVGNVKMCSTGALKRILLIETDREKYGITPEDEEGFVNALRSCVER